MSIFKKAAEWYCIASSVLYSPEMMDHSALFAEYEHKTH